MLAKAAFPAFFLTLAAFVLFLLVTLSAPVIESIYLLEARYPNGSPAAQLGVFGTCFESPQTSGGRRSCTDAQVGYDIPVELFGVEFLSGARRVLAKSFAGSLVINAIAAGFAGICLVFAFFAWFCASRAMEITTFIFTLLGVLFAWAAFFIDLGVVLVARARIENYTNDVITAHIGNAFWMALGGMVAFTLAVCAAGCGSFGRYSERYQSHSAPKAGRTWPWQRNRGMGTY